MDRERSSMWWDAYDAAQTVFHPDYYEGPWWVEFRQGPRGSRKVRRKVCRNHVTAKAWLKYLDRNGFFGLAYGRQDPCPIIKEIFHGEEIQSNNRD